MATCLVCPRLATSKCPDCHAPFCGDACYDKLPSHALLCRTLQFLALVGGKEKRKRFVWDEEGGELKKGKKIPKWDDDKDLLYNLIRAQKDVFTTQIAEKYLTFHQVLTIGVAFRGETELYEEMLDKGIFKQKFEEYFAGAPELVWTVVDEFDDLEYTRLFYTYVRPLDGNLRRSAKIIGMFGLVNTFDRLLDISTAFIDTHQTFILRTALRNDRAALVHYLLFDYGYQFTRLVQQELIQTVQRGSHATVKVLLKSRLFTWGFDHLLAAVARNDVRMADLLLEYADIDVAANESQAIVRAAFFNHREMLQYLLGHKEIDPSTQNNRVLMQSALLQNNGWTEEMVMWILGDERVQDKIQGNQLAGIFRDLAQARHAKAAHLLVLLGKVYARLPDADFAPTLKEMAAAGFVRATQLMLRDSRVRDLSAQDLAQVKEDILL